MNAATSCNTPILFTEIGDFGLTSEVEERSASNIPIEPAVSPENPFYGYSGQTPPATYPETPRHTFWTDEEERRRRASQVVPLEASTQILEFVHPPKVEEETRVVALIPIENDGEVTFKIQELHEAPASPASECSTDE